ncbi:MAG TPA: 4Fe-4S binding protein [Candidatus Omnitrophota bacterium]|nr:4Fe-4S binding protein [Candidatus Omnitrophota bacterium]
MKNRPRSKKLVIARRISQLFFLTLFIYILWSTTYPLKGGISPEIIFRLDPLIVFLTSLSERVLLPGTLLSLMMIVLTFVLGRFFCGWVCPLGTLIDGFGAFRKKKNLFSDASNRRWRRIKWFLLSAVFLSAVFGMQIAWVLDPMATAARFVSMNLIPTVTLTVQKIFVGLITRFELYGGFYDFYRNLQSSVLGVNVYYFSSSQLIFAFFLAVTASAIALPRLWCRMLCPLGAIYRIAAGKALMERRLEGCTNCGVCKSDCRMGAIRDDSGYVKGECILCMDCVYDCPPRGTRFGFSPGQKRSEEVPGTAAKDRKGAVSRKEFLFLLAASIPFLGGRRRRFRGGAGVSAGTGGLIRPPGALPEEAFVDRCVRCGNCMKVCITNGLQPVMLESGAGGIWTPQLVPEIGYCEYQCTLCGNVCPTGAIPKLAPEVKCRTSLGVAVVEHHACIAWANHEECIVCEEHCPVPTKAIKLQEEIYDGRKILKPVVDKDLCIGCGLCQHVCPVRPVRAIRVRGAER